MARAGLGSSWDCLFANDFDQKKQAVYDRNWGAGELTSGDIWDIDSTDIPCTADLAWASFPCQDLSSAGSRAGLAGDRSGSFWGFAKHIKELSSQGRAVPLVVLENVVGTLTSHNGRDFQNIAATLAEFGYNLGALVIDGALFLPQSRPRLFIVAAHKDYALPQETINAIPQAPWHTPTLKRVVSTLSDEIQERWLWWQMPIPRPHKKSLFDIVEVVPTSVTWHTKSETRYLLSLMDEVNRRKVNDAKKRGRLVVGSIYRRTRPHKDGSRRQRAEVRFDGIAGCLRTPAGGSSRQTLLFVEGRSVRSRLLSPREAARLMGLPEWYQLPEIYNDAYRLAGDGLVVPAVEHLAKTILNPIVQANRVSDAA